jgi:hypothetical protein
LHRGTPGGHTHGFADAVFVEAIGGGGPLTVQLHSFELAGFGAQQIVSTWGGSPTSATAQGIVGLHATAGAIVLWFDTAVCT